MLHFRRNYVADVEEIRSPEIGREVLLLDLEPHHFRVFVTTLDVIDRHAETLALRVRAGDGRKQVRRERRNAALARQVVADESNLADFRGFFHDGAFAIAPGFR